MIKIIADTLSGISVKDACDLGIPYLPQIIIFGDESYRDDSEINSKTFLEKLVASSSLPKTAAPPPALYTPIYNQLLSEGHTVIVICPSIELSGTYRSAMVAAQDFPQSDIRVIDTRTIGASLGSIVLKSLQWIEQGVDADTLVENINEMASRERTYFIVDTLEFLRRGGRIGNAQALVGSILQVKPILTLKDGRTEAAESQRTKRRAVARLHEIVLENCPREYDSFLAVQHGGVEEEAKKLAEDLKNEIGVDDIRIVDLPPAVLTHAGPGALSVSFFIKKNKQQL
jgi:EDD domain protein, DegV family